MEQLAPTLEYKVGAWLQAKPRMRQWLNATSWFSSPKQWTEHPSFDIMRQHYDSDDELVRDLYVCLLVERDVGTTQCIGALSYLLKTSPVQEHNRGWVTEMREDWLRYLFDRYGAPKF